MGDISGESICNECGHPANVHGDGMEPACLWETCLCTGFEPASPSPTQPQQQLCPRHKVYFDYQCPHCLMDATVTAQAKPAPSPTQREPEDEMLVALDDTTTCLGNLLGTLIVHYPGFAANHLVKADVDIAVMRLHLSKELLIRLKGEPALEFKPTSFCEECCNAICTCAATQREPEACLCASECHFDCDEAECLCPHHKSPSAQRKEEQPDFGIEPYSPADAVIHACGLLDVIKGEWGDSWSEHDQKVRAGLSQILTRGLLTQ